MQATLESFLKLPSNWSVSPLFFLSVCLSLYPSISACLSLTYALCLVFLVSLALSHSCSISHLYKEPGAHSSGHSDESVWMKGRSHRPELMLLLHIRNVWNADRLHTVECKTLWCSFAVILCGSDALCSDSQIVCTAVIRSGKKLYYLNYYSHCNCRYCHYYHNLSMTINLLLKNGIQQSA